MKRIFRVDVHVTWVWRIAEPSAFLIGVARVSWL
jgi:hypothetical protein